MSLGYNRSEEFREKSGKRMVQAFHVSNILNQDLNKSYTLNDNPNPRIPNNQNLDNNPFKSELRGNNREVLERLKEEMELRDNKSNLKQNNSYNHGRNYSLDERLQSTSNNRDGSRLKPKKEIPFKPSEFNPLTNLNDDNPYSFHRHFKKAPRPENTSELIRPNNASNNSMLQEGGGPIRVFNNNSGLNNNVKNGIRIEEKDFMQKEAGAHNVKESPIFKTGKKIVTTGGSSNQNNIYQHEFNAFKDEPLNSNHLASMWHKKANPSNVSEELNNLLQTRGRELEYQKAVDVFFNLETFQPKPGLRHQNNNSNVSHVFPKDQSEDVHRPGRKMIGGPTSLTSNYNMISNEKKFAEQDSKKKFITPEERQKALDIFFNLEAGETPPVRSIRAAVQPPLQVPKESYQRESEKNLSSNPSRNMIDEKKLYYDLNKPLREKTYKNRSNITFG